MKKTKFFFGEVINIGKSKILFDANNIKDLNNEFKIAIDSYLESCKKQNKHPIVPVSNNLFIDLPHQLQERILQKSMENHIPPQQLVCDIIDKAL